MYMAHVVIKDVLEKVVRRFHKDFTVNAGRLETNVFEDSRVEVIYSE